MHVAHECVYTISLYSMGCHPMRSLPCCVRCVHAPADGVATDPTAAKTSAAQAKAKDIVIVTLGVGSGIDTPYLNGLSSTGTSYSAGSFKATDIAANMAPGICAASANRKSPHAITAGHNNNIWSAASH